MYYCGIGLYDKDPVGIANAIDKINELYDYIFSEPKVKQFRDNNCSQIAVTQSYLQDDKRLFCSLQNKEIFLAVYSETDKKFVPLSVADAAKITDNTMQTISQYAGIVCGRALNGNLSIQPKAEVHYEALKEYKSNVLSSNVYFKRTADLSFIRKKDDFVVTAPELHEEVVKTQRKRLDKSKAHQNSNNPTIHQSTANKIFKGITADIKNFFARKANNKYEIADRSAEIKEAVKLPQENVARKTGRNVNIHEEFAEKKDERVAENERNRTDRPQDRGIKRNDRGI